MRTIILLLSLLMWSCAEIEKTPEKSGVDQAKTVNDRLALILDAFNLKGILLIYDSHRNKFYSNDIDGAHIGDLPASTFKIPNTIIGLEIGLLEDDRTVFKWDGTERALVQWEKDLSVREAFHLSCVPCYQELAGNIGINKMSEMLSKLNFGAMDVNPQNLTNFWLAGNSKISPYEQIDFLKRFYNTELPISKSTTRTMKSIMVLESRKDYTLSGKTGWALDNDINTGWFVGFVENEAGVFYFATMVMPGEDFDMSTFPNIRKEITKKALREINIIR